ncbi:MAG: FG-GAP repeat protein [Alphaproteobacteria bacterium]|nr:FG-GAP repeat protein [Alphaproteobacteria bacterium]
MRTLGSRCSLLVILLLGLPACFVGDLDATLDPDGDKVPWPEDCDNGDPDRFPGNPDDAQDGTDQNCDGVDGTDADRDGWASTETGGADCDDTRPTVNPGADEICDGVDNDCSGAVDDDAVDADTWFTDGDGDSYGADETLVLACEQPSGLVAHGGDCDDTEEGEPVVYPGAPELCDGLDNDCDGEADEEAEDAPTWYTDSDGDGYGDEASSTIACEQPEDTVDDATDCDDSAASVFPGAEVVCNDGLVNDCDRSIRDELYACYPGGEVSSNADAALTSFGIGSRGTLSSAGDVDGDGLADILVGGRALNDDSAYVDAVFVITAALSGESSPEEVASTTFMAASEGDELGQAVAATGDVDGDGLGDYLMAAPLSQDYVTGGGSVYLVTSQPVGRQEIEDWSGRAVFAGTERYMALGSAIAAGRALTADGGVSIVLSAEGFEDGDVSGAVYVVEPPEAGASVLLPGAGISISGEDIGEAIAVLGDVNGDGFSELLLGSHEAIGGYGAAFLFLGPLSGDRLAADADLQLLGNTDVDESPARAVATAGDVNGDGAEDFLVCGSRGSDEDHEGAVYLVSGAAVETTSPVALDEWDSIQEIYGPPNGELGYSCNAVADVDRDGHADFLIGARDASGRNGRAYLVYGSESIEGRHLINSLDHIEFQGSNGERLGSDALQVGDMDGDGLDDLLLSGSDGDGVIYLLYGASW